jgi:hypothetical protein
MLQTEHGQEGVPNVHYYLKQERIHKHLRLRPWQ